MEEEETFSTNVAMYILGSVIFYLFMKGSGEVVMDNGVFWPVFLAVCIVTGKTIIWWSRYHMPHVTVNGFSGSILNEPYPATDKEGLVWAVFNTGEYLDPFHGKGKLATLVVPWYEVIDGKVVWYLKKVGKNYIGSTLVDRVDVRQIESAARIHILNNEEDYNSDLVYFGRQSEAYIEKNPEVQDWGEKVKVLEQMISFQRSRIENKNDEIVEFIEMNRKAMPMEKRFGFWPSKPAQNEGAGV